MTTKTIFGTSSNDILHADTYAGYGTRAGTFPGFNKYKIYGLDGDDSLTAYFNYLGVAISSSERNFETSSHRYNYQTTVSHTCDFIQLLNLRNKTILFYKNDKFVR